MLNRRGAAAAAVVIVGSTAPALGQEIVALWRNGLGGSWTDVPNWQLSDPTLGLFPQNTGTLTFDVFVNAVPASGISYEITLDTSLTVDSFSIGTDLATLTLQGATLTLTEGLDLTRGTIRGEAAAPPDVPRPLGDIVVQGGSKLGGGTLIGLDAMFFGDISIDDEEADLCNTCVTFVGSEFVVSDGAGLVIEALGGGVAELLNLGGGQLVFGANSQVTLGGGAQLVNGAGGSVVLDGAGGRSIAGDGAVVNEGSLLVTGGAALDLTGATLENTGLVRVENASLTTDGLAGELSGGVLTRGAFEVAGSGTLTLTDGAGGVVSITELGGTSRVTLDGAGSGFAALDALSRLSGSSVFALGGGRTFATQGDFEIAGGATLALGAGTVFTLGGDLAGISAGVVTGDLAFAGNGSLLNSQGQGVLSAVERIADGGALRLRGGRQQEVLGSAGFGLVVEGALEIGSSVATPGGSPSPEVPGGGSVLSLLEGDYRQADGSELIVRINGADDHGVLRVLAGAIVFGDSTPGDPQTAGELVLVLETGADVPIGTEIVVLEAAGGIFGEFAGVTVLTDGEAKLGAGLAAEIHYDLARGEVSVVIVPAPAVPAALLCAGVLAARRRR